ncbi:MAG: PfkB family carbohydrate kinase [Bosea sp. (in: a-proteobacteria)]
MTGVFCIGIAVLDYVYGLDAIPSKPEKHRARDLAVIGGGLAANASVAVARLGGRSWLATRLGEDATAQAIVDGLAAENVETQFTRRFPGLRSPVSAILVDKAGERMVISYSDPQIPVDPSWLPSILPEGAGAVLGDTRWSEGAMHCFALARASKLPAVLDGDRAPGHPDVLKLATHAAFGMQGLTEATGESDPRLGLAKLARDAGNWLAVTMGAEGVLFTHKGQIIHQPGFAVASIDTLGAGDVWHGAFALALAEGQPEPKAVRFASATAALKCTRFGGRAGTPSRPEVEAFLKEHQP